MCRGFNGITLNFILKATCLQMKKLWPKLYGKRLPGVPGAPPPRPPPIRGWARSVPWSVSLQPVRRSTTHQLPKGTRCFQGIPLKLRLAGHSQQVFGSPSTGMRALDVKGGSKAWAFPGMPAVGRGDAPQGIGSLGAHRAICTYFYCSRLCPGL